jgi:transcriptional regulator with XRE-family HTH domain
MAATTISPNESGARLRAERERAELSMRELAYFAKVSHPTIQRIENGTMNPSPAIKARLARLLRLRLEDLWPLDEDSMNDDGPGANRAAGKEGVDAARRSE